jgi:hypothetical protein
VIVVGVRQDDGGDNGVLCVVALDMSYDLIASVGKAAVNDIEIKASIFDVAPLDDNSITVAVTCAQKIDLVWQGTLLRSATPAGWSFHFKLDFVDRLEKE